LELCAGDVAQQGPNGSATRVAALQSHHGQARPLLEGLVLVKTVVQRLQQGVGRSGGDAVRGLKEGEENGG
jgi:hypothetical protein